MDHWWRLATRSWRAKPGRTAAVVISVALGVATVVTVTSFYETVRRAISERVVVNWLGRAHLSVEHFMGHWGRVDQKFAQVLGALEHVDKIASRSKRPMMLIHPSEPSSSPAEAEPVDVVGIQPGPEYEFRDFNNLQGRLLAPDDQNVAMLEADAAEDWGVGLGGTVRLAESAVSPVNDFTVVGLYTTRRLGRFQRPTLIVPLSDLQRLKHEEGVVTVIDLMLDDPSESILAETTRKVQAIVDDQRLSYQVSSAQAKLEQLRESERNSHLILMLVAVVTMLTSFFIILTTMGMGIVERIGQLGNLRCLGMTRGQLAGLIALEVIPLGVLGVILGIPLGLGATHLGAMAVPEYVQGITVSLWGIQRAAWGGIVTTVVVAAALAWRTCFLSPLEAATPHRRAAPPALTFGAAGVGIVLLIIHEWLIAQVSPKLWFEPVIAFTGLATLYGGYVLLAPALVAGCGAFFAYAVGTLIGIRGKLAKDQLHKATWRGAAICWMLMVGLSLIVYIAVRSESLVAAWNFPSQLPETFVWSPDPVSSELTAKVAAVPGVLGVTTSRDFECEVGPPQEAKADASLVERIRGVIRQKAVRNTFVAGEPETFTSMAKVGFLQGSFDDVNEKLHRGGYVLLPPQAARAYGLGVGDKVRIAVGPREAEFEVAGVVQSPAMDIAVSYFEAESYLMVAASGAVLGTIHDAREHFGIDGTNMFMMNIGISEQPTPEEFQADKPPTATESWMAQALARWQDALKPESPNLPQLISKISLPNGRGSVQSRALDQSRDRKEAVLTDETDQAELNLYVQAFRDIAIQWNVLRPEHRWEAFREQIVLRRVAQVMDRPDAVTASVRRLKESITNDIRQAILLLSVIPAIALIVASLGVANLMIVSVTSRWREIAVLRAVGATKSQVVRLVLAEAISLGGVGCVVGVLLGLHSARSMNQLTSRLIGFQPVYAVPWDHVLAGVALTALVCVAAGIVPARYAARNNIVDAMQAV